MPSTSQAGEVEMPFQVSLHTFNSQWYSFYSWNYTHTLQPWESEMLIILQNHSLEECTWSLLCLPRKHFICWLYKTESKPSMFTVEEGTADRPMDVSCAADPQQIIPYTEKQNSRDTLTLLRTGGFSWCSYFFLWKKQVWQTQCLLNMTDEQTFTEQQYVVLFDCSLFGRDIPGNQMIACELHLTGSKRLQCSLIYGILLLYAVPSDFQ